MLQVKEVPALLAQVKDCNEVPHAADEVKRGITEPTIGLFERHSHSMKSHLFTRLLPSPLQHPHRAMLYQAALE